LSLLVALFYLFVEVLFSPEQTHLQQGHHTQCSLFLLSQKNSEEQESSHISSRVELAEAKYNIVLNSLGQNLQDSSLLSQANRARAQTIMLRKVETMKNAQLIKNKYLLQADRCSKFFNALTKRNRHSQFIATIKLENGQSTASQPELAHPMPL